MKQLAGGVKVLAAVVLGMGIFVALWEAFDNEEVSVSLIISMVILLTGVPCLYYLFQTGWKDWKRESYRWTKLLLSGLFLYIVLTTFVLYYGIRLSFEDIGLFGPTVFAAAIGLAIGLNDMRCWRLRGKDGTEVSDVGNISSTEEVQVRYRIERREWVQLNLILSYEMPVIIYATLIGAGSLLGGMALIASGPLELEAGPVIMIMLAIVAASLPLFIWRAALKNHANEPFLNQEIQATLAEDGLRMAGSTIEVRMNWKELKRGRELAHWLVFMTRGNRGFFIPKRVFTPQQLIAVRFYIKRIQAGAS
jgi:hypothetical protein